MHSDLVQWLLRFFILFCEGFCFSRAKLYGSQLSRI